MGEGVICWPCWEGETCGKHADHRSLTLPLSPSRSLSLSLHSLRWSCYVRTAGPGRCRSSWASPGPGPPPFVPASWLENSAAGDGKVSVDTANFSTCLSRKASARRSGGAEGAAARSNGVADGPDRRAGWWLCRVITCGHVCGDHRGLRQFNLISIRST